MISHTPPEIDIILLQQIDSPIWTEEQRAYLPDGIRDSLANHVLIELKMTETVNREAIQQALMYDIGYQRLKAGEREVTIQSFLVSAKTPNKAVIARYGYQATAQTGVYRSDNIFIEMMPLLVLNELSNEPYNVFFKLFASRVKVKRSAVVSLRQWWLGHLSLSLRWFIQGLLQHWLKGEKFVETLTPEQLKKQGKLVKDLIMPLLNDDDWATILEDTPYLEQIQKKGERKGLLKGRVEGRVEGREEGREEAERHTWELAFKNIRQTLVIRFQTPLDLYDERLETMALPVMEKLNGLAFEVKTLAEFEAALQQLEASASDGAVLPPEA